MSEGLSARVAERLAALRYDDLPPATVAAARFVLLDALGVMLAASGMAPEAAPFVTLARSAGGGPAAILGTGLTAPAPQAALANGALAHALDYEDTFDRAPSHPNASLVPALIALAQARAPVGGREFLTALAAGGDFACRVALALRRPMEEGGWYPPPITAAFGAAAGCGRLLGLDPRGMLDCLSLALCQATMPGEIKHSSRTVLRAVREAFPAQAAVTSALLAEAGVAGFERPLEGEAGFYALFAGGRYEAGDLLDGLGERFWIEQLTFKPWPSCRGTHPFIEMALSLRGATGDARIERIVVSVDEVQLMLVEPAERKREPATAIDAKFSIPFVTALALARGRVTLDDFSREALCDRAVLELAAKVEVEVPDRPGWQRGSGGALAVELAGGERLSRRVEKAYGCPERPLGEAALVAKFVDCAGRARIPLGVGEAEALAGRILALEGERDVGALFG